MRKKIIPLLICILLITTAVAIAEAKILALSKEHMMKSNEYLAANLSFYPTSYDFGNIYIGEMNFTTIEIWNTGCCYLHYTLTENCTWVDVQPYFGTSTGEHDIITVYIDTSFLDIGFHQCDIQIKSNAGEGVFHVNVTSIRADTPKITLYPRKINFGDVIKGNILSTSFEIWNCGIDTLSYSIDEIPNWIIVNPSNGISTGEHDTITVNITTSDLSAGLYEEYLQINSNGGNKNFLFYMNVKNPTPELAFLPHSYNFGYKSEEKNYTTTFKIWNSGIQTLTYTLFEHCDWITVSPENGVSSGEYDNITITINTKGLEQHSNNYDIFIDSNGGVGYFKVTVLIGEGYRNITIEQAYNFLTNTSNGIQIPIDVRYDSEWAQVHIDTPSPENPKHHCLCAWSDETVLQEFMELYKEKEIIVYCKGGSRSLTAVNALVEHNFSGTIYNMLGGIDAWILAGYPTKPNTPPNIPFITGDTKGKVGENYQFTVTTTDVDSDDVYYYVNWSDNTSNQLVGPYHSGEEVILNHTWSEKGTYILKVKARDIYGAESDYAILKITMKKNLIIKSQIFNFLQYQHLLQIIRQILHSIL